MQALSAVLPASTRHVCAWVTGLSGRIMPLVPEPYVLGQPQLSVHAFVIALTPREQPGVPAGITGAGGLFLGLEMAYRSNDGWLQPLGPVVTFLVEPMGHERSRIGIQFPIPVTKESLHRVVEELKSDWPGVEIREEKPPPWAFWDFDRRDLFEAVATGGPPPPGAPPRRYDAEPWPDRPMPPSAQPEVLPAPLTVQKVRPAAVAVETLEPAVAVEAPHLTADAERLLAKDHLVKAMVEAISAAKATGRSTAKTVIGRATGYSGRHMLRKVHDLGFPTWKAFAAWVPARQPD